MWVFVMESALYLFSLASSPGCLSPPHLISEREPGDEVTIYVIVTSVCLLFPTVHVQVIERRYFPGLRPQTVSKVFFFSENLCTIRKVKCRDRKAPPYNLPYS